MISVCQEKYLLFFGNNEKRGEENEKMAAANAVFSGWADLLRHRADMAAMDENVHVFLGRHLFCNLGQNGKISARFAGMAPGGDGSGGDYGAGAAVWVGGQPTLQGLGLPGHAPELPGADLLAFFRSLDALGHDGNVAVW